jgi:hypothetical protein
VKELLQGNRKNGIVNKAHLMGNVFPALRFAFLEMISFSAKKSEPLPIRGRRL